jgi:hypothetical protein
LRAFGGSVILRTMRYAAVTRSVRAVAATVLLGVTGCSGGGDATPAVPASPAAQSVAAAHVAAPASPPSIDATVKSKTEKISAGGGKLTLPALPALKGSFGYPSNNAPSGAEAALSASLSNAFDAPTPSGANIVYFLQADVKASGFFITFNSGTEKAKIEGSLLNPADSYTLYVFIPSISNQPLDTISAGSPTAKHVLEFTSPFNSVTLPVDTVAILELGQS